ncbi:hypothetical protein ABEH28_15410 [Pseudomonas sp. Ps21-P2]|uniref:hypothetical protein n=1 Tax=Pseudomonas sp. Ps21-P2 TaxID=3080331 RepID=UPI00320B981A
MDKILLTAFLTALAGFITAALSIVKLVNEKESKTTEFRQGWTDSVRASFAELIGAINAQASLVASNQALLEEFLKIKRENTLEESEYKTESRKEAVKIMQEKWSEGIAASRDLTQKIHQGYAMVRLHFKPDEPSFVRFENKFDSCTIFLHEIKAEKNKEKRLQLKEQVHSAAEEMTSISRGILKETWETVKLGEPAYKDTKKWSVRFCVLMLFILFVIGSHAMISYYHSTNGAQDPARAELNK